MNKSYIAMGTNIEPRKSYIDEALFLLDNHAHITIEDISSIYETDPVGYLDQADFLNLVIKVTTSLNPIDLLNACQSIERQLGRERTIKNGPRTIDLDILMYEDEIITTDRLILPHPRMMERAFVLVPLQEVAKHVQVKGYGKTVNQLLNDLPQETLQEVRKWQNK